jgi:hypothetical protein
MQQARNHLVSATVTHAKLYERRKRSTKLRSCAQHDRPAINLTPGGTSQGATFSEGLCSCSITALLRTHFRRAVFRLRVFNLAAPDNNKKRTWFPKATSKAITEIASKMKSKLSATASRMFAMSTSEALLILYLIFAHGR